ncbi:hypothetical protein AX16_005212 [Volvariella volvacea WC 439]|nr:hypothetical protein AX16_005212 [Volvariella volvacea WC 439]
MIEHFVVAKGGKADPQLIWSFGDTEIGLKSLDSSLDGRGRAQLATELTLSCEEFDLYKVHAPVTIAFHLREFNATIAFAESMALPLEMKFTSPSAPLFIDMEGDSLSVLFIISTSPVQSAAVNVATSTLLGSNNRKRERNESVSSIRTKPSRMLEAHQPSEAMDVDGSNFATSADALLNVRGSPSVQVPQEESDQAVAPLEQLPEGVNSTPPSVKPDQEPLFWPSSSQLNEAGNNSADSFILYEEAELAPTQGSSISSNRSFQPLFED